MFYLRRCWIIDAMCFDAEHIPEYNEYYTLDCCLYLTLMNTFVSLLRFCISFILALRANVSMNVPY